ncbi:MAG: IPT/TIG domain-containing protein [Bryobacteraceae bacterium]|nr:IPT/TIG domain-containing protein [Bryobacteraceae bacterium]
MMRQAYIVLCLVPAVLLAQAPTASPVVSPRGVVNTFTQLPAPSVVAPGGLVTITGLNLGPADTLKADAPWPTKLGEVEVLINGRPAAVGYVSPGTIIAQVPYEIANGLAQVVVRRGEAQSRPARFQVIGIVPSLKAKNEQGFGEAALAGTTISVSGLGATEPRVPNGEVGSAVPRSDVRALIGGLPAGTEATMSATRVGEWEMTLTPPAGVADGDAVIVAANGRSSNPVIWRKLSAPVVEYVPLPEGTPELRVIQTTDLRASVVAGTAARGADGCYKTWVFDTAAQKSSVLDDCMTAANPQIVAPVSAAPDTATLGGLVGPPLAQAPNPVSAKVKIYSAVRGESFTVDLPSPANTLNVNGQGNYLAAMGPAGLLEIDSDTGETRPVNIGGAGAVPGGGGGGLNPLNLTVDLGDGLKVVLAVPTQVQNGVFAVVVGDNADKPTKAKMALVNAQGQVSGSMDFPAGWVPLVPPAAPVQVGPGGGGPLPGAVAQLAALRTATFFDAQLRNFVVLGRKADDSQHAAVVFSLAADAPVARAIPIPEGWFAVTCTPRVALLNLELSRRLAFFADRSSANEIRNPCSGQGFVTIDLTNGQSTAIPLQGAGLLNASAAAGEMNDFVFAANIDPSRNNRADTVFVMDGVSGTSYRFDAPTSVQAITNLTPVPELNMLVATAAGRTPADGGFLVLDLERVETRLLPIPDGFTGVQLLGVYQATRKLVARGTKTDGSSLLIYDLISGDLLMPKNPDGVAFFGPPPVAVAPPGQGGGGGGQQQPAQQQVQGLRANEKSSAVAAIGYTADRKQVGIVVVRVP